jgi:ferritin-like metal-binding protein YciE
MPKQKGLHEIFVDEVRDCYDAERQLVKALPKMVKAATSPNLTEAFSSHLVETRGHVTKLEEVFASLEEKPRGKRCDGMAGILEEAKSILDEDLDEGTLDAALIAAGQRAEHYEMAAYGTLVAWARAMGHQEAAGILEGILREEKAADKALSSLAENGINRRAAASGAEDQDATGKKVLGDGKGDAGRARTPKANRSTKAGEHESKPRTQIPDQRGRHGQPNQQGWLGQGNAPGRPPSQLGKQVPANEQGKRLLNTPGRTGSRRADR